MLKIMQRKSNDEVVTVARTKLVHMLTVFYFLFFLAVW